MKFLISGETYLSLYLYLNFKEQRGFVKELDARELKILTCAATCPLLNQFFEYQLHCQPRHNRYSKHQFGNAPNNKVPAMSQFGNTHVVRHLEFSISLYPFPSQNLPILLNFSSLDNRTPSLIKLETLGMSEMHIRKSITILCPRCWGTASPNLSNSADTR